MSAPFEAASYLFRSERRVHVLELLAGEPRTPGELAAETDASRKTVRRALGRFEEFGWVRRTDRLRLQPPAVAGDGGPRGQRHLPRAADQRELR
ncbi:hypothetical protein BRC87_05905, partial [Halobacteriales archaeon QS_4_66_20]